MHVLSIGADRKLFEEGSAVRDRVRAYYEHDTDSFTIIVFATKAHGLVRTTLGTNGALIPTTSRSRWEYVRDAVRAGREVLKGASESWVVTVQDPFESGLAGWILAKRFHVPLQVQIHTDFGSPEFASHSLLNRVRLFITRMVLPKATRIRVVSERIAHTLVTEYGIARDRIDVLPISDSESSSQSAGEIPAGEPAVLMVARLEPEKDVATGLRAFARFAREYPRAALLIAGDGSLRGMLEKEAERLGISPQVHFLGWRNDVSALMAHADMLLVTSRFEGYGRMFIEAARAECPIVTTDVGIIGDVLIPEEGALVCPVGEVVCLADALARLARDENLGRTLATHARQRVAAHMLSEEEYRKRYMELLVRCLK